MCYEGPQLRSLGSAFVGPGFVAISSLIWTDCNLLVGLKFQEPYHIPRVWVIARVYACCPYWWLLADPYKNCTGLKFKNNVSNDYNICGKMLGVMSSLTQIPTLEASYAGLTQLGGILSNFVVYSLTLTTNFRNCTHCNRPYWEGPMKLHYLFIIWL